jgi:hypothetical protein
MMDEAGRVPSPPKKRPVNTTTTAAAADKTQPSWLKSERLPRQTTAALATGPPTPSAAFAAASSMYVGHGPTHIEPAVVHATQGAASSKPSGSGSPVKAVFPAKAEKTDKVTLSVTHPPQTARPQSASPHTRTADPASDARVVEPRQPAPRKLSPRQMEAALALERADVAVQAARAAGDDRLAAWWARLDSNGNGVVSLAELDKWLQETLPGLRNAPAMAQARKLTLSRVGGGNDDAFVVGWLVGCYPSLFALSVFCWSACCAHAQKDKKK